MSQTSYAAGARLESHSHALPILSFAVRGSTELLSRTAAELCEPGSLLYLPAGAPHANVYPTAAVRLHVEVGAALWRRWASAVPERPSAIRFALGSETGRALCGGFVSADSQAEFTILCALLDAIGLLSVSRKVTFDRSPAPWLLRVREFLEAHCTEAFDIGSLAGIAGRHPVHVSREFRRHFGKSMSAFVRERRLVRAAGLIARGQDALADIALQCGFYDQSHFTRCFRKFAGVAPGHYRAPLPEDSVL